METNVMKSVSIKKAFKAGVISAISPVRENTNDYLFVTVVDKASKSHNLYLGRNSSENEEVVVDKPLTVELIKRAEIVLTTNAEGEQRLKLSLSGESTYSSLGSLFDDELSADEAVVLKALAKSMEARVTEPANSGSVGAEA